MPASAGCILTGRKGSLIPGCCPHLAGTLIKQLPSGRPLEGEGTPATTSPPADARLSSYRTRLLRDNATYDIRRVMPLPSLPVLTSTNAEEYPEWHAYVASLYGASPPFPIALDTFSWFYWTAPLQLDAIYLCDWSDPYPEAPYGTPWTGGLGAWEWGPEHMVRRAGFFVHREPWAESAYTSAERLEVMRIGPIEYQGFVEDRQAWFFHAIGSGIYVRPPDAFTQLEVYYERHMAIPRVELVGFLPYTEMLGARSPAAAFWPASMRFELSDGSPCESTALQRRILSCANMPVPIWAAEDDPRPQPQLPRGCVHDISPYEIFTSYNVDCTQRRPLPPPPPPQPLAASPLAYSRARPLQWVPTAVPNALSPPRLSSSHLPPSFWPPPSPMASDLQAAASPPHSLPNGGVHGPQTLVVAVAILLCSTLLGTLWWARRDLRWHVLTRVRSQQGGTAVSTHASSDLVPLAQHNQHDDDRTGTL